MRKSDHRRIPRFRCATCRRTFCSATFRTTYWLRYRHLLTTIARLAVAGAGLRQIARTLRISHSTVARHISRAGRHGLLFQLQSAEHKSLDEPIVADGFETFEFSKYFPYHVNLAVGRRSWLLYFFTDSPLRRKGRMRDAQKRRRAQLEKRHGRPDPKAIEKAMSALLAEVARMVPPGKTLQLHTDEHEAYPRALRRLQRTGAQLPSVQHLRTPSFAPRTPHNPLFAVNLIDLLLRHCQANHRRKTIAHSKRRQGGLERLAIFMLWRNYIKKCSENGPQETPAMVAGIVARTLEWREIFRWRLFPGQMRVPPAWVTYYWRRVKTLALGDRQREHTAKYAF